MSGDRMYPIQKGPSVPWSVMAPHESRCQNNHQQSIQRIAERGGFSPAEAWAIVNNLDFDICKGGLSDGTTWEQAERKWIEYAERINNHYAELDHLRADNARLKSDWPYCSNHQSNRPRSGKGHCPECLAEDNARLTIERDEAKAATDFANLACDRKDAQLATYKAAVVSIRCDLEQALQHLDQGGNGKEYDPSWIRPKTMSREQITNACQQAYHRTHSALHTLSALTGDATPNPLKSPSL